MKGDVCKLPKVIDLDNPQHRLSPTRSEHTSVSAICTEKSEVLSAQLSDSWKISWYQKIAKCTSHTHDLTE